jgi:hypothetical protein
MAKRNSDASSPMTDYPKAPSPFGGANGTFDPTTPRPYKKGHTSYGVIDPVQYYHGLPTGKGGEDPDSPMNQQITPKKPKGS